MILMEKVTVAQSSLPIVIINTTGNMYWSVPPHSWNRAPEALIISYVIKTLRASLV